MTDNSSPSAALSPQEIESLLRAIAHRRSLGVKRLKADPVPHSMISQLLEAANWAPSHGETEPWRFTVFTGDSRKDLGNAFATAYKLNAEATGDFSEKAFESQKELALMAPVWISIGMTPSAHSHSEEEECMAVACAVQNFHLTASALGLAGMWQSNKILTHSSLASFLKLDPPSRLLGFFPLGFPNIPWPAGERTPIENKVVWARN